MISQEVAAWPIEAEWKSGHSTLLGGQGYWTLAGPGLRYDTEGKLQWQTGTWEVFDPVREFDRPKPFDPAGQLLLQFIRDSSPTFDSC